MKAVSLLVAVIMISSIGISCDDAPRYSETQRVQIFNEFVKAQDKADREAEQKYPLFKKGDQYPELYQKLIKKYESEVLQRYDLSPKEMTAIRDEAEAEGWPMPELT